jgi:hypothetical protein
MKRRRLRIKIANGRLYVGGRRLHHGATGVLLALIGIGLVLHDLDDAPWFPTLEWADR